MHWYVKGLSCKPNIYVSWSTSELSVRLARHEIGLSPPVKYFLLTVPRRCFFCGSFMLFRSCFCYACVFVCVCLSMPCVHLLERGWPLGFRLWCLILKLSLFHWYPGSGAVLDCIDSWSLPSFLLCCTGTTKVQISLVSTFVIHYLESMIVDVAICQISIFLLVSVAEQARLI